MCIGPAGHFHLTLHVAWALQLRSGYDDLSSAAKVEVGLCKIRECRLCVRLVVQVAMRRVRLLEQLFETAHPSVPAESRDKKRAEVRAAREF